MGLVDLLGSGTDNILRLDSKFALRTKTIEAINHFGTWLGGVVSPFPFPMQAVDVVAGIGMERWYWFGFWHWFRRNNIGQNSFHIDRFGFVIQI